MKLERLHEYLLPTVAILGGMGFAIYCGRLTGYGQVGTLSMILLAMLCTVLILTLKSAVWMLVPITWTLSGQIMYLPLPFAIRDLVVMFVFVSFLIFKAVKISRRRPEYTMLDTLLLVALVYLVTVFIRNPVGVEALGSTRVGGRPYFNVAMAFLAYWVLSRVALTPRQAMVLPFFVTAGRMFEGALSWLTYRYPALVPILSPFYSTIAQDTYQAQDVRIGENRFSTGRKTYFMYLSHPLAVLLCAKFRPITLITPFFPLRALAFSAACIMALLSGYRTVCLAIAAFFLLSTYFRRGILDVIRVSVVGGIALMMLILLQGTFFNLPLAAQRALSFLPGRWDPIAVADAKASTRWRTEMWKEMLGSNKYIDSRTWGDGFGLTRVQLERIYSLQKYGTTEDAQESYMRLGGVHSGPVSAVRYVGYVGLGIFIVFVFSIAAEAWRMIRRAENTPYYFMAIFVSLPLIWEPLNFIFIFGSYENALPEGIFAVGMLKMLKNSLESWSSSPAPAPTEKAAHHTRHESPALAAA